MKVNELKNMSEAIRYWHEVIANKEKLPEREVAWRMTDIMGNDLFQDEWYKESKGDPDFVRVLDLVSELELPQGSPELRNQNWQQVRKSLKQLEEKYLK